jgi:hypothetical protein
MSRISSQGTVIMMQSDDAPAGEAITAITKAKPAVLSITATTAVVGDLVVVRGSGFASLDDRPFLVSAAAAGSVTLGDSDTTGEAGVAAVGATLEKPPMAELCRSTLTVNQPAGATIDVTTLCDDAHKIVSGLPAIATWAANGFYDADDTMMLKARDYYRSGELVPIQAIFRDGSGIAFVGNVNVFDITAGINAAVTNNLGGNISGLVSFFPKGSVVVGAAKSPAPDEARARVAA